MAIFTDLPNELLLSISADVSPLYIDSFALSCKRIYDLCTDTIREHTPVRSRLAEMQPLELLRTVSLNSELASYPTSLDLMYGGFKIESWNLATDVIAWALENPYTAFHKIDGRRREDVTDLAMTVLVTSLLNLRKIDLWVGYHRYILDAVSQIVEASHEPLSTHRRPLAFGRLTEVSIMTSYNSTYGMSLAILLAMIPSVRKLKVLHVCNTAPFVCPYPYYDSGVTDISLEEFVDSSYLVELIGRTRSLQKFTYTHRINGGGPAAKFEPRRLGELLKKRAGNSLLYLNLQTGPPPWFVDVCRDQYRNHNDLSLGPLRGFSVLRVLVTCVDMFIKTRGLSEYGNGTGTVQRLVSWLPASLEMLVLHQGLEKWDKDVLRMLFRGFRNTKQARIPSLKLLNFVDFPDFDQVMPDDTKAGCRETRVKIGYTMHSCGNRNCRQLLEQLENWEGLPCIGALGECCRYESWGWAPIKGNHGK